MYFQAFGESQESPLSEDLTYIVEHLVSQMLAAADVDALKTALQEQCLADMLINELEFLGQIPRSTLPQVRDYLIKQEPMLTKSTWHIAQNPHNEVLRQELCTPRAMLTVRR